MNSNTSLRAWIALVAVALLVALAAVIAAGAREPRPNVIVISVDTLRPDRLGVYGHDRATSPSIDALAAQSLVFENAYSQSPKTAPSHMSLMTGLYPEAHGVRNLDVSGNRPLDPAVPTMARVFQDAGYRTAAFTGGGHVSDTIGFASGFEVFKGSSSVELNVKRAREFIGEDTAGPFFLFLHTYEVHDPYVPPTRYRDMFADSEYSGDIISVRRDLRAEAGGEWGDQHGRFWEAVDEDSEEDRRHLLDLYDASIRYTDAAIGELLSALGDLGVSEDTIVVLLSDHGEMFGEHGDYLHNALYDEILRVPLVVHVPDAWASTLGDADVRGGRIDELVRLIDVMPTLLDLTGLQPPSGLHGRTLVPGLRGSRLGRHEVLSHWPRDGSYALRLDEWKLIAPQHGPVQLYDIARDPSEHTDLSAHQPDVRDSLLGQLSALQALCRARQAGSEAGADVVMDVETRRALEALGYIDGRN